MVEKLLRHGGYDITLFNRGKTGADLFPEIRRISGDRETEAISQIGQEDWDFVVDVSCYYTASLSSALAALKRPPEKYIFISTCSVYENGKDTPPLKDENAPLLLCDDAQATDRGNATYGHRKVRCEEILAASGLEHTILRPALVYGWYDHLDRSYYWLWQVKQHDRILVPDGGQRELSFTYVDDLCAATIQAMESALPQRIYNAITVPQARIIDFVQTTAEILGKSVDLVNATPDFLRAQEVRQWSEMPIWIDGDFFTWSNDRMLRDGLAVTDFRTSMEDTIAYYDSIGWPQPKFGMSEARRLELLGLLS